MIRFLFVSFLISVSSETMRSLGQTQGRSIRINPYIMKYLQQMASHPTNFKHQQRHPYLRQRQQLSIKHPSKGSKISLQSLPSSSKLSIQPLGVKPLLMQPVYGQTYLNQKPAATSYNNLPGQSAAQGKYTFAQAKRANTSNGKNVNQMLVALPNLGNLLYKYAQKQVATQKIPVYNQNLYHLFEGQTPPTASSSTALSQQQAQKPSVYTQQQYSSSNSKYASVMSNVNFGTNKNQQSQQPKVIYTAPVPKASQLQAGYAAHKAANTGYQSQAMSARSGYNAQLSSGAGGVKYMTFPAPQVSPTQMSYLDRAGNLQMKSNYGVGVPGTDLGGMLYISGPAEQIVNLIQKQSYMPTGISSPSLTRYSTNVVQLNGDTSSFGQGVAKTVGSGTTCGTIPGAFCRDRKPGHYTNPGSDRCFIQCDAFGRGYNKECAPGTSWNVKGPEPALYNMCS